MIGRLLHDFNAEFDDPTPGPEALTERVPHFIARDAATFLLVGSPPVGIAEIRFRDSLMTGEIDSYLEELYVAPDHRGRGFGKTLLERALEVARERGATRMDLATAVSDKAARRLYESLGFINEEKPGDPTTQMLFYEIEL